MDFKYRWKNGRAPTRDEAAKRDYLLDESQFETESDRTLAEQDARRQLNVPLQTDDANESILPKSPPPEQKKMV